MNLPINDNDPLVSVTAALKQLADLVERFADLADATSSISDATLAAYRAALARDLKPASTTSGQTP